MSAISIALLPALNCLWSYFHNSKNIHNAFCIMSYGIGAMSWNIMFTQIVNPNNAKAIINANNIAILPYDVVQNFPICARFI